MTSALIITGPTASGKTSLALKIANIIPSEIVNADVGQFYKPLSIGTAKPDWKNNSVPHHLFDIIDRPEDLTVFRYRALVLEKVQEIFKRKRIPIIVGGSFFYLKSLFYPPIKLSNKKNPPIPEQSKNLWQSLFEIDPQRAETIHPNDTYRLTRALMIWKYTGDKPSSYLPKFDPEFNANIIFLCPDKEVLKQRINDRTIQMFSCFPSWIDETKLIMGTEWEAFLEYKKLIGYPEIIKWIKEGQQSEKELIEIIQKKTWGYARRQIVFWKSFSKMLIKDNGKSNFICKPSVVQDDSDKTAFDIVTSIDSI